MINFRIIARIFGLLLIFEGLFMLVSAGVSYFYKEPAMSSFIYSAIISIITGVIVFTPLRNEERIFSNKEGYIIITGTWLIFSLFGMLPFLLSGSITRFEDAFFESMSGFTTTGATILTNVESMPHGILFWRSLTQWLGGISIIFISLSALPVLKSMNIQLANSEFSGHSPDKIHPRIMEAAKRLTIIYITLTIIEVILLVIAGLTPFDAVCHSFSTLSTGGFSTNNEGIAAYGSPYVKIIITVFMFIAGTNMATIYFGIKGNFKKVLGNNEFVFYFFLCFVFILISYFVLYFGNGLPSGKAFMEGSFNVVSIITTTGFYTNDYSNWSNLMRMILFILMFTGGTSGSTSGGIKIIRLILITKNSRLELIRLIHPSGYLPVRHNRHTIPQSTIFNLLVFITIYFIFLCFGALIITFMDYDIITSFSTSASMLANIGPGIGSFGPFSNYSDLPGAGKIFLAGLMLLGRLEFFAVMILFTKNFYKH